MKRLAALMAFAVVVLCGTPASAQYPLFGWMQPKAIPAGDQKLLGFTWNSLVKWAGCPEAKIYILDTPNVNARFTKEYQGTPAIILYRGLLNLFDAEPQKLAMVILHETRHCLQWKTADPDYVYADTHGEVTDHDRIVEMSADAFAARLMTVLGYPGLKLQREIRHDFAVMAHRDDDTDSGSSHPSTNIFAAYAASHLGLVNPRIQGRFTSESYALYGTPERNDADGLYVNSDRSRE